MWGTNTRFWRTAETAGTSDAFAGVCYMGSAGRGVNLSPAEHRSLFLFDPETARDLGMMPEKKTLRERRHFTAAYNPAERTLFEHRGLVDLVLQAREGRVVSSYARDMLTRAVLVPERTPEGIEDRHRMIRALQDGARRQRLDDFFSKAALENKTAHIDESFLDTFGTLAESRHAVIGEA